ncbi:MAG: DUF4259 domain-containing protein [Corynebacterium sp.]|nr:DUF4259 domain-containing protein [Corynebacterium sp.]
MSTWDIEIFSHEANTDFLDELAALDNDDIVEAVEDSCKLVLNATRLSPEEKENGLCAATIAAIWAGAPFSAGDVADDYPFLRELVGHTSEELSEAASAVLEAVRDETEEDSDLDIEPFIEALE